MKLLKLCSALLGGVLFSVPILEAKDMKKGELALSAKQQSIVIIAAFTANGELDKLKTALQEGLDSGLTVNEIKEILVQMYAYCGFPRSLNAINTFMAVMKEREAAGIKDIAGAEAKPMPVDVDRNKYGEEVRNTLAGRGEEPAPAGYQLFTPVIDLYLKEHLFGDIFGRDNLDYLSREIATIAALSALKGTDGQLVFHYGAAMNVGLTKQQAEDIAVVIKKRVGKKEAKMSSEVLKKVLEMRG